jgi:type IV pilus assembly protein PilB
MTSQETLRSIAKGEFRGRHSKVSRADHRLDSVLQKLPRSHFIASEDLRHIISGRSIPTTMAVRQMLEQIGPITSDSRVLVIGSGAGYLPAVLANLAREIVVVEREDHIARIARANFESAGLKNIQLVLGDGEAGAADLTPFDLIVCSCFLSSYDELLTQLSGQGRLFCMEGADALAPSLIRYQRDQNGEMQRAELGAVIFSRDTGEVLIDLGYIDEKTLRRARVEAERRKQPVLQVLRSQIDVEDGEFYRDLARQHDLELRSADEVLRQLDVELFQRFSKTFLDNQRLLPVRIKDGELLLATDNPDAPIEDLAGMQPHGSLRRVLVTPTDFKRIWSALELTERSKSVLSWKSEPVSETQGSEDLLDVSSKEISHYLVSIYEAILLDAVSSQASDIHVERYGERIRIRIRVDGELQDLEHYKLTPRDHAGLINVIKVRAEINIAERRLPQGGRTHMRVGTTNYDLRIQIQPSLHGEHAVIRLLSQTGRVLGLNELGMAPRVARFYQRLLDNPAGLVLVVGPTGSGKSTTLYAALQTLAEDGRRKVITVEDPIEYSIDNIQQTRVRSNIGFNFDDAMRSFVRQDPDVILVGEIRDRETALEAIRASQTGHLVLSTLHSNDAVDALQRMFDLGVHPNSIAGELLAIIAQRLAKRICTQCRVPAEPDPVILRELFPEQVPAGFRCFEGRGCKACGGRGTRGRVAVIEYMHANDDIRNLISRQPPVGELRWQALDSGLITMRDSALNHVIQGVISQNELPRILPQDRMAPEHRGGRRQES